MSRNLKAKRPDLDPASIDRLVHIMNEKFPDALVTGYEHLISVMTNDPKDRHVLAAAVRAGAAVIVTWNLTDFQSEALAPYDIDLQTPDVFLCHLWHLNPGLMAYILREQAAFLKDPPTTLNQLLDTLAKHVPTLVTTARTSGLL